MCVMLSVCAVDCVSVCVVVCAECVVVRLCVVVFV